MMRKVVSLLSTAMIVAFIVSCGDGDSNVSNQTNTTNFPYDPQALSVLEQIETLPKEDLTEEEISSLIFMWNEEKLAKDLYYKLAETYPEYNVSQTFYNIATNSEAIHQESVEILLNKYKLSIDNQPYDENRDLNNDYPPGAFSLQEIQTLYDQLLNKGSASIEDALKVGCIVEVTDVNDLNARLAIVDNQDIIKDFEFLRQGSYNHYWAFDKALKSIGIQDGCCSLGEEYCKTLEEYPPSNMGTNGNGNRP